MPLVERIVTITGERMLRKANYIVKIGTNVQDLIDYCGGTTGEDVTIKMGGPMMGVDVCSEDAVVEKRNNAITVMKQPLKPQKQTACIRCGRCHNICPENLHPEKLYSNYCVKNRVLYSSDLHFGF